MTILNIPLLVFGNPIALLISVAGAWLIYMWLTRMGVK